METLSINEKINAKGNREVFYNRPKGTGNYLIRNNYKIPFQDMNLPYALFLESQIGSNYKGH